MRNQLVLENLPLVGYLVSDVCARNSYLSREDLASVGAIALITAADAYKPELGVPFGAYARRRILGALADDMRSADWAGRGQRARIREAKSAQETLTAALGRKPTVAEIAAAMGVDERTAATALHDASRKVVALDEDMNDYLVAEGRCPEEEMLEQEQIQMLRTAVENLPERMRMIITRLFFEGSTVKEIAAELGITHSAVSQQRTEAMRMLRAGLGRHYGDDDVVSIVDAGAGAARREKYVIQLGEQVQGGPLAAAEVARALKAS